jgi:hypothetical protein
MKRKSARLALVAAIVALVSGLVAGVGSAAAPTLSARLFATAGPVMMHATLTLTGARPAAPKVGSLSACVVKPTNPRMGIADKLVCKNAHGQSVTVPLASTTATLSYRLAAAHGFNLQSATVQIRHKDTVLFSLTASSGTLAIPLDKTAALLNGHDTLSVQAGAHTYRGQIVQVK